MRNYNERAKSFIEQIFPYILNCHDTGSFKRAIIRFNIDKHRRVQIASGLTRVAMITSDYVVKVDCGSNFNLNRFGDCEREVEVYAKAEQDGFEYLLAKIERYTYQGYKFYIMPRIYGIGKTDYDADYYTNEEETDWLCDHVRDLHYLNYGWKNDHIVIIDYACSPD